VIGLPFGFSFALVGFFGFVFTQGWPQALSIMGDAPYSQTANYILTALPLFVLMGQFAFYSGISQGLFNAGNKWMGRLPGGLALATMIACTAFAACTGSSVASAATMAAVSFPEMKRYNYSPRLSTAVVAVGGTLGILIPPSTIFVVLGIITSTSIGDLFIAGIIPGILLAVLFLITIYLWCLKNPSLGPRGQSFPLKERFKSLTGIWGMLALFILVIGGLYFGVFSPSEAGSIGAAGALILALVKRAKGATLIKALKESALITAYMLLILIGAQIFNTFISVTGIPKAITSWVLSYDVPAWVTMAGILILYIPLGMFIDTLGMILLTVPIWFPVSTSLGYDPVWFGVMICVMAELGMITPPVAINVYVVQGITKVPISEINYGIIPFIFVFCLGMILMFVFPQIVMILPQTMH
jgi:C4-dicarboxylate transporter DctM subunit